MSEMTWGSGWALRLERPFPASRATVYTALTNRDELATWFGPHGFTASIVTLDPRVGGSYQIAMQPPAGDLFHISGEFKEVEPPARLAYTFQYEPPTADDRATLVILSLLDRGESTEVNLIHGPFATQERYALHEAGWSESFERLERLLGGAGR
jgi:uncharacterized protein YndB with AHSA1/START domain